ncbi:hypothetical protein NE237_012771 [Protea cynaroides]|uniref:Uncharacterized protein n=1 Tax=Protea cynaroides TaxID=273540 RepID=A0A9Q0H0F7_9MAGN|nr:hypothetical protein NE237_012771 [Protea cynaroides]
MVVTEKQVAMFDGGTGSAAPVAATLQRQSEALPSAVVNNQRDARVLMAIVSPGSRVIPAASYSFDQGVLSSILIGLGARDQRIYQGGSVLLCVVIKWGSSFGCWWICGSRSGEILGVTCFGGFGANNPTVSLPSGCASGFATALMVSDRYGYTVERELMSRNVSGSLPVPAVRSNSDVVGVKTERVLLMDNQIDGLMIMATVPSSVALPVRGLVEGACAGQDSMVLSGLSNFAGLGFGSISAPSLRS